MGPLRPHEPIHVDDPKEIAHFLEVMRRFLFKDDRDTFLPWIETNWGQPISKPIGFLDSPLTLEGVDREVICFEAR